MFDPDALEIYIDGSAITNPGSKVGCAGVVAYPDYCGKVNEELTWSYNAGTNNDMELLALINALKWINKNQSNLQKDNITRIIILSDSEYVVNGSNNWVYKWKKNNWLKSNNGTIKHASLWKEYLKERLKIRFSLDINWKKGKSEEQTKRVDELAKKAAKIPAQKINFQYTKPKIGRSISGKKFPLETFMARGQTIIIRVCAHGAVNQSRNSECEVRFEEISSDYHVTGRFKSYTLKEIDNKFIHRGHFYQATFNKDARHPLIEVIKEIKGMELEKIKNEIKRISNKL